MKRIETGPRVSEAQRLSAQKITVKFQGLAAISDVSLSVERKEILGLIGPNGAGKTTLVNVLTGFQLPTTGSICLADEDITGTPAEDMRKRGIARTFQAGRLFKEMTLLENVEVAGVGLGLSRKQAEAQAMELLAWVGLEGQEETMAGALAYTDERRVSIARAMVQSPAFILLDEPAAGMSDSESDGLSKLIKEIPQLFNCGVVLIEHNMDVIMSVSDRIHVLSNGMTIAQGTPAEIRSNKEVLTAYLGEEA